MKPLFGKTVLVVDDEPMLREIISDELREVGANILEAGSGMEARCLLRAHRIDCVITDVRMPDGNGLALLEEVRADDPSFPPVILITGFSDFSIGSPESKGAFAVFGKPFDVEELMKTVIQATLSRGEPVRSEAA